MRSRHFGGFSTAVFEVTASLDPTLESDFYGRFLKLKNLDSPYLAKYVEFSRLTRDSSKIALTTEHPKGVCLSTALPTLSKNDKYEIAFHILSALRYLHSEGIIVKYLSPQNVIIVPNGKSKSIKLIHYGSFFLVGDALFDQIMNIFTLSPEAIGNFYAPAKATDNFALGILLLCILLGVDIHTDVIFTKYGQIFTGVLLEFESFESSASISEKLITILLNTFDFEMNDAELEPTLNRVVDGLLKINPVERPLLGTLLDSFERKPPLPSTTSDFPAEIQLHLWKLCGKSTEQNLIESKFIRVLASISMISYGHPISRYLRSKAGDKNHMKKDYKIFILPDDNFQQAICDAHAYMNTRNALKYRSGCREYERCKSQLTFASQFERFVAFYEDLYSGRSVLNPDTPNSIRSELWSRSLIRNQLPHFLFHVSNQPLANSCKHQLSLDLPRCHQYDEAMTSDNIQAKVALLIEKNLAVSPDSSAYWQGLDSLIAPFALLFTNDLERGFAASFDIIERFTPEYFTRHSSYALEEALRIFAKLISFSDSNLAKFLRANSLTPSTYAVPWLLTCYAHVFAFDKLFHSFDRLLDRDSSYPLCIGLSIMEISSQELMDTARGDEAFKVLSNVSDIDIRTLIKLADVYYESIPSSCFYRVHAEVSGPQPTLRVAYSDYENDNLYVPKVHPEQFHLLFHENKAALILCDVTWDGEHVRVLSLSGEVTKDIEKRLRVFADNKHVIGVIGGDCQLAVKRANAITDCGIDKVCLVDSTWSCYSWSYSL